MLIACHDIRIGAYRLAGLVAVAISHSTEALADTATITLPSSAMNVPYVIEGQIKRGDAVSIRLGYDDQMQTEFTGYVRSIHPDAPLKIECEDAIYLTRKIIADKSFKKTTARAVLEYTLAQLNMLLPADQQLTLQTDINGLALDSFTIVRSTAYEVLEKIKELTYCTVYMRGTVLHFHLAYSEKTGEAIWDFAKNIEDGSDLEYVRQEDRKLRITVVGKSKKGKLEVEVGEKGGDTLTIHKPTVSDKSALEQIGKELLKQRTYDGYKGSIRAWLWPYCQTGFSATIRDATYPQRAGVYYVTAVKTEFGPATGGRRTISLGIKLADVKPALNEV